MFGFNIYYVLGSTIGGVIGIYLFSLLFRYALLGSNGTKLKQLWVVLLTGIVAIGFSAFGDGTDGFVNRITNPPNIVQVISYSIAALIVGLFVWLRVDDTPLPEPDTKKTEGIVGRAVALVFVVPMILIGFGNLGGSLYSIAVHGAPKGAAHNHMRQIMLTGDLAPFWQLVDERAPEDMDRVIEGILGNSEQYRSDEDARQQLVLEMQRYRIALGAYAPGLTDAQRVNILQSSLDLLLAYQDQPALCVEIAMTGGQGLTQEELLMAQEQLNRSMIVMTENLLNARDAGSSATVASPSEEDYGQLVQMLIDRGLPDDQLQALFNGDATHPQFCAIQIAFLQGLVDLDGAAGEAVRADILQTMLTTAP